MSSGAARGTAIARDEGSGDGKSDANPHDDDFDAGGSNAFAGGEPKVLAAGGALASGGAQGNTDSSLHCDDPDAAGSSAFGDGVGSGAGCAHACGTGRSDTCGWATRSLVSCEAELVRVQAGLVAAACAVDRFPGTREWDGLMGGGSAWIGVCTPSVAGCLADDRPPDRPFPLGGSAFVDRRPRAFDSGTATVACVICVDEPFKFCPRTVAPSGEALSLFGSAAPFS